MIKKIGKSTYCINITPRIRAIIVKLQLGYFKKYKEPISFSECVRRVLERGLRTKSDFKK